MNSPNSGPPALNTREEPPMLPPPASPPVSQMAFTPGAIPPDVMAAAPMDVDPPGMPPPFMPPFNMNMPGEIVGAPVTFVNVLQTPTEESKSTDWTEHKAPDGRFYYYNSVTKERAWKKPHELKTKTELMLDQTPWKEYESDTGDTYYHNIYTNESCWSMPTELEEIKLKIASEQTISGSPLMQTAIDVPAVMDSAGEIVTGAPVTFVNVLQIPTEESKSTDWTEHKAADGKFYYFNSVTKQSAWKKPHELKTKTELMLDQSPWKEYKSDTGTTYYHNIHTNESSWCMPAELEEIKLKIASEKTISGSPLMQTAIDVPTVMDSAGEIVEAPVTFAKLLQIPTEESKSTDLNEHKAPDELFYYYIPVTKQNAWAKPDELKTKTENSPNFGPPALNTREEPPMQPSPPVYQMAFTPGAIPPDVMAAAPMDIDPPGMPPPFIPPFNMNMPGEIYGAPVTFAKGLQIPTEESKSTDLNEHKAPDELFYYYIPVTKQNAWAKPDELKTKTENSPNFGPPALNTREEPPMQPPPPVYQMAFTPGAIPPDVMAAAPMDIDPPGMPPPFIPPFNMNMPGEIYGAPVTFAKGLQIPTEGSKSFHWTEHIAPNGQFYYYNSVTKQSAWEKPHEFKTKTELMLDQSPWKECKSDTGTTYYHNIHTNESSWCMPAELEEIKLKIASEQTISGSPLMHTAIDVPSGMDSSGYDYQDRWVFYNLIYYLVRRFLLSFQRYLNKNCM